MDSSAQSRARPNHNTISENRIVLDDAARIHEHATTELRVGPHIGECQDLHCIAKVCRLTYPCRLVHELRQLEARRCGPRHNFGATDVLSEAQE